MRASFHLRCTSFPVSEPEKHSKSRQRKTSGDAHELKLLRDPDTNGLGFFISNKGDEEEEEDEEDREKDRGVVVQKIVRGGPAHLDGTLQKGIIIIKSLAIIQFVSNLLLLSPHSSARRHHPCS